MLGEEKSNLNDDAIVMVYVRNAFYKRKYHLVLGVLFLNIVVISILIGMLIFLLQHPSRPLFFAADEIARLIQDVPVQQPNMSNDEVAAWVQKAIEATYSYDFMNYRSQLQDAQKYFTDYGWRNYMKGLTASNNLLALTQRKMVAIAKVVAPPKLVTQGPLGNLGALAWKFEMPVLVTYLSPPYDDKSKFENPLQVSVIVQRQKILESYRGLGIIQMISTLVVSNAPQVLTAPTGSV